MSILSVLLGMASQSLDSELVDIIKKDDLPLLLEHTAQQQDTDLKLVVIEACKKGAIRITHHCLNSNECTVDITDNQGNTLLHLASESGVVELLEEILEKMNQAIPKWNPFCLNSTKDTALHSASSMGRLDAVVYLIEKGQFDYTLCNEEGMSVLHIACKVGAIDVVKYLTLKVKMDPSKGTEDENGVGTQPLHYAAMYGHGTIAIFLIEECNCDPHMDDNRGRTSVYLAADGGDLNLMKYLVQECHCDVNRRTKPFKQAAAGRMPLHSASFQGHLDIIKYLVMQCNCDPLVTDEAKVTPLACASQEGKVDTVKYLTIDCKVDGNYRDGIGRTPLHYACLKGRIEVAKTLTEEAKVDINILDNNGETPTAVAAKAAHLEVVEYMIHQSDCNLLNDSSQSGRSILHFAAMHNWVEIAKYLFTSKHMNPEDFDSTGVSSLHHAAEAGSLDVLKYFIEECKSQTNLLSKEGEIGNTPLLKACTRGRLEVATYLIEERQCSLKPSEGKAMHPIHLACSNGHIELAKYLLDKTNQTVHLLDKQGALPIHFSVLNGHLEVSKLLIEQYEADPLKPTPRGATAVHAACQGGHLDLLKYLIGELKCHQKGTMGPVGGSPLHRAVEYGHIALVKYLIEELVCAPNQRDANGRVALHFAALKGFVEIAKYLLEIFCDVMIQDSSGSTPLHLACESGHEPIIELLLQQTDGASQVNCKDGKSNTPLQLAKKSSKLTNNILMMFLKQNVNVSDLMEVAPKACGYLKSHQPLYSFIKVFFVGEYQELIQELHTNIGTRFPCSEIQCQPFATMSQVETNYFDNTVFYEVPTALSCNSDLIIEAMNGCRHPVIVISLDSYQESEAIIETANHWMKIITKTMKQLFQYRSSPRPLLVFELDDHEKPHLQSANQQLLSLQLPDCKLLEEIQIVYSVRRTGDPYGARRLIGRIANYTNILQNGVSLPSLVTAMNAFLKSDIMSSKMFCTLQQLIDDIISSEVLLPIETQEVADILTTLSQSGYVIFIRNTSNVDSSWIILDTEIVTNLVKCDLANMKFNNPLGIVQQSELIKQCTAVESSVFLLLIKYAGVCINLTDALELTGPSSAAKQDLVYYFPHIVSPRPPSGLSIQTKSSQITFGRIIQSPVPFSVDFTDLFPVALPLCVDPVLMEGDNHNIAVWSKGAHWCFDGIKMGVVNIDNQSIVVIVKGKRNNLLEVTRKRNDVVRHLKKLLLNCSDEEDVSAEEYLIHPDLLKIFHFDKDLPQLSVIPLSDIVHNYRKAERAFKCPYKEFIGFEPYHIMKQCSTSFFDEDKCHDVITREVIADMAERFSPFSKELQEIFGHKDTAQGEPSDLIISRILTEWLRSNKSTATYNTLWNSLKQYSQYT